MVCGGRGRGRRKAVAKTVSTADKAVAKVASTADEAVVKVG